MKEAALSLVLGDEEDEVKRDDWEMECDEEGN
jgi:hypothetical protein